MMETLNEKTAIITGINKIRKVYFSYTLNIQQYISLQDMSKPKRVVVFVVLPFAVFMWLVGWCINWVGTKKVKFKTKVLKIRNSSKSNKLTPNAIAFDTISQLWIERKLKLGRTRQNSLLDRIAHLDCSV